MESGWLSSELAVCFPWDHLSAALPRLRAGVLLLGSLWHATGTDTGVWDPPGLAPSGRQVSSDGADFQELRDGRICSMQVTYDVAGIMRQLGVRPQPGSRGEHLITTMANLRTHLSWH